MRKKKARPVDITLFLGLICRARIMVRNVNEVSPCMRLQQPRTNLRI